jgi:hypothetical protein
MTKIFSLSYTKLKSLKSKLLILILSFLCLNNIANAQEYIDYDITRNDSGYLNSTISQIDKMINGGADIDSVMSYISKNFDSKYLKMD